MQKKIRLFTAAVLTVFAMSVVPIAAHAGEFTADCSTGQTCNGTVEGTGPFVFSDTSGISWQCPSFTGNMSISSGSSTGSIQLLLHGCTSPPFELQCGEAGTITSNSMVTHNIYIDPNHSTPGVLVTGVNLIMSCPGVIGLRTFTGNVIGHFENPECGVAKAHHTFTLERTGAGQQRFKQVTTTGTIFDLIVKNDVGGVSLTAAWSATAHVNYTGGNTVRFTC
jgi:hypothetical protein